MVFHDGHVEAGSNSAIGSALDAHKPWVDSDGRTHTNINDQMPLKKFKENLNESAKVLLILVIN